MPFAAPRARLEHIQEAIREIEGWHDIAAIGKILRHGYDSLEHAVIWGVVEHDLPPLKAAVEALLRDADKDASDRA